MCDKPSPHFPLSLAALSAPPLTPACVHNCTSVAQGTQRKMPPPIKALEVDMAGCSYNPVRLACAAAPQLPHDLLCCVRAAAASKQRICRTCCVQARPSTRASTTPGCWVCMSRLAPQRLAERVLRGDRSASKCLYLAPLPDALGQLA